MSNYDNPGFDPVNDEENESQPSHLQNRGSGLTSDKGQAAGDSSIGSGSSDQGIEPGDEYQEDEFRKKVPGPPPNAGFIEGDFNTTESDHKKSKEKNKGLVEEGPGPDA